MTVRAGVSDRSVRARWAVAGLWAGAALAVGATLAEAVLASSDSHAPNFVSAAREN
jgi:hypothetical protein